jgi:hypothetical protein
MNIFHRIPLLLAGITGMSLALFATSATAVGVNLVYDF